MLRDGAPGPLQETEAEAEGLCPCPSAGTGSGCCGVGKLCRQRNGGLDSAAQREAGASHGPC